MSHNPYPPGYGAPGQQSPQVPLGDRQAPWPPPASARPAEPPGFADFAVTGTPFTRMPLTQVWTLLPTGRNIAIFGRQRPIDITVDANSQVSTNTAQGLRVYFERPTAVFQITGAAVSTDAQNPIVGDPRDTFLFQAQRASGAEEFLTAPALGSTVIGTAERPFHLGPNGWLFSTGETMVLTITPLRPNLRITINFSTAEVRGPANFTWGSVIG